MTDRSLSERLRDAIREAEPLLPYLRPIDNSDVVTLARVLAAIPAKGVRHEMEASLILDNARIADSHRRQGNPNAVPGCDGTLMTAAHARADDLGITPAPEGRGAAWARQVAEAWRFVAEWLEDQ